MKQLYYYIIFFTFFLSIRSLGQNISEGNIQLRFYDCITGKAVLCESINFINKSEQKKWQFDLAQDYLGKNVNIHLPEGNYIATAEGKDIQSLTFNVAIISNKTIDFEINLLPLRALEKLPNTYPLSEIDSSSTFLSGYVNDQMGTPIKKASIIGTKSNTHTITDDNGYFQLRVPLLVNDSLITEENVEISKTGYLSYSLRNVLLYSSGHSFYNIRLYSHKNNIPLKLAGKVTFLPLLRNPVIPDNCLPNSIKVGRCNNCNLGLVNNCPDCCHGDFCTTYTVYPLDEYVKRVLPAEWFPSWKNMSGAEEAYKAGAIAIRSYAISSIGTYHNFDICSDIYCQAFDFNNSGNVATNPSVDATKGMVLTHLGHIAHSEFSSETNSYLPGGCGGNRDLTGGCTDGYFYDDQSQTCIEDPVSKGKGKFGHNHNMSQTGSVRWATGLDLPAACNAGPSWYSNINHINSLKPHGFGTKNYKEILQHYYPNYDLVNCVDPVQTCPDNFEPNNSYQTSHPTFLNPLFNTSQSTALNSYLSTSDDQDWYSLGIDGPGVLTINLSNLPADYDLELYGIDGNNGQAIAKSYNNGTSVESIIKNQPLGLSTIWYIRVYPKDASQNKPCDDYLLTINWQPSGQINSIPPGNYKKIELYGLNVDQNTNDLEFMYHAYPAQTGDKIINIQEECSTLEKIFKTAIVTPLSEQWISINPLPEYYVHSWGNVVQPVAPLPFKNSEMANRMFLADLYLKQFWDAQFRVDAMNYWKGLVLQSPFWGSIHQKGFNNYAFFPCRAAIIPGQVSVNSSDKSIQINSALLSVESQNFHTPYILPGSGDLNILTQQEKNDLNTRLQIFDKWITSALPKREPIVRGLLNNHFAFDNIRQIYTTIALAEKYKQWNYLNKPIANIINSKNMIGIADPMIPDKTIVDMWNQSYSLVPAFNQVVPFTDFTEKTWHMSYGGCTMRSINPIDSGALSNVQKIRDSVVFQNKAWINQDSTTYFYGGAVEQRIAELTPILLHPNSRKIALGDTVQVNSIIYNIGNIEAQNFEVRLYEQYIDSKNQLQSIMIGQQKVNLLDSFDTKILTFAWVPKSYGNKKLFLTIDEGNAVYEKIETNNTVIDSVAVVNNTPFVQITLPANGSAVSSRNVTFSGIGYDSHDNYLNYNNLTWSSNIDGFLGTGNLLNIDSLTVGSHIIKFAATDSHGQTALDYINIYVYRQGYPNVNISLPVNRDTFPSNMPILFLGSSFDLTDGDICSNVVWSSNIDGTFGKDCSTSHSLSPGNHTIKFTATNSSRNTSIATVSVSVVNGLPKVSIIQPQPLVIFYQNQSIILQAYANDFLQRNISNLVKWYSDIQGYLGTGQYLSVKLLPGNHLITAVIQDKNGFIDTAKISTIIKFTPPVPIISKPLSNQIFNYHDTLVLIGHAMDLQDGSLHGSNLRWYSNINGFLGFSDTLKVNSLSYGYHIISLKAVDSDGRDSIISITNIYIDPGKPSCTITQPKNNSNLFYGNEIKFLGSSIDSHDGIISGDSLQWFSDLDGLLGSGDSITIKSLSWGSQTITLKSINHNGFMCSSSVKLNVEYPHTPIVSLKYPNPNSHFLHGSVVIFEASATDYEEGMLNNNRIYWSSSINGNIGTGRVISVTGLSVGTHIISVTVHDTTGLITTAKIQIIIDQQKPKTQIKSPISNSIFGQGTNVTLSGVANDYEDGILGGASLQWKSSIDGVLGTGQVLNTISLSYGSHLITLTAIDSNGGKDSASIVVIIQAARTILLTQFSNNVDSLSHLFPNSSDTILYISVPKKANVLNAQLKIIGHSDLTAKIYINAIPSSAICETTITFFATFINGGSNPSFQWKLNGMNVGMNSPTFTSNSLQKGDKVSVEMRSSLNNISEGVVISNVLIFSCTP